MWGDEVECFRARRCNIGGIDGDVGISRVVRLMMRSDVLVLRLSWLGFLFMAGILGLINEGDEGSDTRVVDMEVNGGWIERPFIFFGLLGAGDVIGLSMSFVSEELSVAIVDRPPNDVAANELSGRRVTGESGDEEGEGSERDEESVHDMVVVGEDSADSDL
jgi:hypothetical protein